MADADAINVDAADNAAEEAAVRVADKAAASSHNAENKEADNARHWRRSSPTEKPQAGSIRSAKEASSADRQIVIWPNPVTRTFRPR